MKIAMMTNNYKPFVGGVPVSVERLTCGLRERGHEVCVFAPEYRELENEETGDQRVEEQEDVVRYRSCRRKFENGMVIPDVTDPRIREAFAKRKFDLIHVHHPMLIGNVAVALSRRYQLPLIYTYHTRYEEYLHYIKVFSGKREWTAVEKCLEQSRKWLPRYMASFMNKCDLVLAPSAGMRDSILRQEISTPVRILPTGLNDGSYVKDEKVSDEIRRTYLGDKRCLFCTVSRLEKEKNLYFLLRSIQCLRRRVGDGFSVMVIGDGAERPALELYAKELGIEGVVRFVGEVPNQKVKNYLFASDVFLFASQSETQGIVLAEAMAEGLPVAAVSACGVNDIVKDAKNGYLTAESEDIFAAKMEELMMDHEKRCRFGANAIGMAQNYQMAYIAAEAEEVYRMILEKRRRAEEYGHEAYEKKDVMSSVLHLFKAS